jgi:hypothetical protein
MGNVPDDVAVAQPQPGRWSIAQHLDRLSWMEGHVFRARLDNLAALDPADAPDPAGNDPEEIFAHWEEQRADALEHLREHGADAALLNDWVRHDLETIRHIAALVSEQLYGG